MLLISWVDLFGAFSVKSSRGQFRNHPEIGVARVLPSKLSNNPTEFSYLKRLDERCKRLSSRESEFLLSFWSDTLKGFQIFPNMESKRLSITTTCLTLSAILSNPSHWNKIASWQAPFADAGSINIVTIFDALMNAAWSGDAFQTPVLVSTLVQLRAVDISNEKFVNAVNTLLDQRSRLSLHRNQPFSSYLRHRNIRALLAIAENNDVPIELVGSNKIGYALERANMVSFDELCRQLAFFNSGDSAQFDVVVLAYSLMTYYETSQSLFLGSFARGVVPATNMKLVKAALEIVFSCQTEDGTWGKGEPIFSVGERRDIGNSYVFFFDLVGSLMGPIAEKQPELLAPYLPNLERCA